MRILCCGGRIVCCGGRGAAGTEVLLSRRVGTVYAAGLWHVPSGHYLNGPLEDVAGALLREAREETGIGIDPADATADGGLVAIPGHPEDDRHFVLVVVRGHDRGVAILGRPEGRPPRWLTSRLIVGRQLKSLVAPAWIWPIPTFYVGKGRLWRVCA
ncbi:NUDIX domain-containing protein [Streptomyces smyrnaeus]|uniref:NUDIX domain-containing protein n=1 Tax=Streptomyces smyrnaeus TaxID=1387713 RepID=UPI0033A395D4